jgi:hypothetical protein
MKRILLVLLALLPLVLTAPPSSAAVKAGSTCTKQGAKQISGGKSFTCIKQGKKFVWNKGVAVKKPTPAVATTPVATPTPAPTPAASTPAPAPTKVGYTMTQVRANNSASNCWSVIDGSVYDLTNWIKSHPGGSGAIVGLCGTDGSAAFSVKHGNQSRPAAQLNSYRLGPLDK